MTGEIRFKMRSEPTRLREAPAAPSPASRSGKGSFDDEALAALEAALGSLGTLDGEPAVKQAPAPIPPTQANPWDGLEATLPPSPPPAPVRATVTIHPGLRTARELIEAMHTSPPVRPPTPFTLDLPASLEAEPPSTPVEPDPKPAPPKELRNGDLPARPTPPVVPDRPRRALAPPLEPPDFELATPKRRRFRWPFGR